MAEDSQIPGQDRDEPAVQPVWIELPPGMREALLDPQSWHDSLEAYAHATHLAVALVDTEGRLLGTCINPQPTWSHLHAHQTMASGECPFALAPCQSCTCIADALATREPV